MSLNVALEFASCGYVVLPVGPDKRPWIAHGVHSASTDPHTILRWSWTGAACAVATGERWLHHTQRPRGTGWVEPRPLEAPPGIEHVDRLVDAQDRIDRAELIAKLTKGKAE
jgi:hypothetical protein